MNVVDLFSGCGGLSLGFESAGFKSICAVDNWKDAIDTYNFNFSEKNGRCLDIIDFNKSGVFKIKTENKVDGILGGPPCQGYSSARLSSTSKKIDHINEKRNKLYLEFFKTVKIIEPKFFIIENVKGLTTIDNGVFIKDILKRFGKIGFNVSYKILNASDFGVPQNRLRVFFVGIKDNIFEFPKENKKIVTSMDAISDIELSNEQMIQKYTNNPKTDYQFLMRGDNDILYNHEITNHTDKTIDIISKVPDGGNIRSISKEYWNVRKFNKAFQRMNSSKPSNTIDTGHRNYFHYSKNRIPTARESARIQSFNDTFKFIGSKSSQYRQIGNAVPPLLAKALADQVKKYL